MEKNSIEYSKISILILFSVIFVINLYLGMNIDLFNSDSGLEYTNAKIFLYDGKLTIGPVVQQVVYATIILFSGANYRFIVIFNSVVSCLLLAIMYVFIQKNFNQRSAIFSLVIILSTPIYFWGSFTMKQYPLFMFLGILFIYYFYQCTLSNKTKYLLLSALFLSCAYMTHILATLFLLFPALFWLITKIFRNEKPLQFKRLIYLYIIVAIISMPYSTWIFLEQGTKGFLHSYVSWGVQKYGKITNLYFFNQAEAYTADYFNQVWQAAINWLNLRVAIIFLIMSILSLTSKKKEFLAALILTLSVPYLAGKATTKFLYLYIFLIPFIILQSLGLDKIISKNNKYLKIIIIFTVFLLSISNMNFLFSYYSYIDNVGKDYEDDCSYFNKLIEPESFVLFRSHAISTCLNNALILQITRDIKEEDAIKYLSWKDDEIVREIFKKYNISYVGLYKSVEWERDYYVWFKIKTGEYPKHYLMIEKSPYFKKVAEGNRLILYKFLEN